MEGVGRARRHTQLIAAPRRCQRQGRRVAVGAVQHQRRGQRRSATASKRRRRHSDGVAGVVRSRRQLDEALPAVDVPSRVEHGCCAGRCVPHVDAADVTVHVVAVLVAEPKADGLDLADVLALHLVDRRAVVAARRLSVCWPQPHDQRLAKLANQTYPGGCAVVANQALLAVCRRDLHGVLVECVLAAGRCQRGFAARLDPAVGRKGSLGAGLRVGHGEALDVPIRVDVVGIRGREPEPHLDRLECPHIGRCDRAAVGGATLKRAVFVLGQQLHLGRLGDVADQCHKYLSIVAVARHVAAADRNGILHVLQHAQHHAAIGRHPAAAAHKHKRARAVSAAAIAPAAAADDDAVKVERGSRATLGAHRHTGHCPAVKRGQRQPGVHARRQLQLQLRLGACRRRRRQCHWLARALFTLQLQEETATPCRSAAAQHDCDVVRPTRRRRQPCLLSWRQLLATAAVVGGKAHKRVAAGRHVQNLDAGQLQRTGGAGARLDVDAAQRAEVGQLNRHMPGRAG
mmetsp:Transcript_3572/g.9974  ORF Transcript_3572/g.9974 Transcript_3572/m.9974 type:complete len:515 (+) Transcript_3572:349-1893(+)